MAPTGTIISGNARLEPKVVQLRFATGVSNIVANAQTWTFGLVRERSRKRSDEVATEMRALRQVYSALRASPFALLRAAPSGVLQRFALQSERRVGVRANSSNDRTWMCGLARSGAGCEASRRA